MPRRDTPPPCWICSAPSNAWRLETNPPWGLNMETGIPVKETEFLEQLAHLRKNGLPDPDRLVGACPDHRVTVRRTTGGLYEPKPRGGPQSGIGQSQANRRKAEIVKLRTQVVAAMGGKCKFCGFAGGDPMLMGINVPPATWRTLGFSTRKDRLYALLEEPELGHLVCMECLPSEPKKTSPVSTVPSRQQVLQKYGGVCSKCDTTENLQVIALPGTKGLSWPGGRRYTSKQKADYLVQKGFPGGWALFCGKHSPHVQKKEGNKRE